MTDNEFLIYKIEERIKKEPKKITPYNDLFAVCVDLKDIDFDLAHSTNQKLRIYVAKAIYKEWDGKAFFALYKKTLLFDAPYFFDAYLLYLEINREPRERFYQPRRKVLRPVVEAMQKLADDELDELFLSMPPRVGKTTLVMFFVTWVIGRNSELSNLYSAFSDTITNQFYNGVLEVLQDPKTYTWKEIFPKSKIVQKDAKQETLNINRKKRYQSLTARSLYGTLNGACDCNGFLISDDLIGSIEEALNPDRLKSAWDKVENNLIPRAKQTAKRLWIGTRWSIYDPIGKRQDLLLNNPKYDSVRYKIINLPALDKNDESQFDYAYQVGYNSEYYRQRRASFEQNNDVASWNAQYMQEPIEREGVLFNPADFRYYNGNLPENEPDRIFMPVDPAFGGGDYVASPVIFQYGEDLYVHDVVYNNNDKKVTQPLLVSAIVKYGVQAMQLELNKSTESYKDGIEERLKEKNIRINLTSKAAPPTSTKNQRIFDKAPDIREFMIFRDSGCRSKEYEQFFQSVKAFKMFGKNKNDDAPDSLAMAIDMVQRPTTKVRIIARPF